jgi:hypothetical protein
MSASRQVKYTAFLIRRLGCGCITLHVVTTLKMMRCMFVNFSASLTADSPGCPNCRSNDPAEMIDNCGLKAFTHSCERCHSLPKGSSSKPQRADLKRRRDGIFHTLRPAFAPVDAFPLSRRIFLKHFIY